MEAQDRDSHRATEKGGGSAKVIAGIGSGHSIVVTKKCPMAGCVICCRKVRLIMGEVSGIAWNFEEGADGRSRRTVDQGVDQ